MILKKNRVLRLKDMPLKVPPVISCGKPLTWPLIYGILLFCYAAFTLLDAFVIPRDVITLQDRADDPLSSSNAEPADPSIPESSEPTVTENSYESEKVSITIQTIRKHDTTIHMADIRIADASFLRTAVANGTFGRNVSETTSAMAENNRAILAINGDYYGFRDRGFVMRQGYLYRDTKQRGGGYEDLVIYGDGTMEIVDEAGSDAAVLEKAGAMQIFSFGPGLIRDGEITVSAHSEVDQAMRSNPRTAIGQIEPLHYIFAVSDGRTRESAGLTLFELAQVMAEYGCQTAYNMDGGGSSTMWFMGNVINNPTAGKRMGERSVSDIVYIRE